MSSARDVGPDAPIVTVILPEYIPRAWWQHILHGQSAQFLKLSLLFRPGYVVVSVPYHNEPAPTTIDEDEPVRPALVSPTPAPTAATATATSDAPS